MMFVSEEIPFVRIGNRRGLTALQLFNDDALWDFVKRFPESFEQHVEIDALLFIEPDDK